jgi:hypothetical protein
LHKFKYTTVGEGADCPIGPEGVESLLQSMKARPTWQGVIIAPDAQPGPDGEGQYPIVSLAWYPDYGYEVHFMELTGESNFLALRVQLSEPEVYVELGGQGQELWPRELFVPIAAVSKALRHLLQSGSRDQSLPWVSIDSFPRLEVKARSVSNQARDSDAQL